MLQGRADEEAQIVFLDASDGRGTDPPRDLLGHLADGGRPTLGGIALADPGLQYGLLALLGRLQSIGLVDSRAPVTPGGAMTPEPYYFITDLGRDFLIRLADETPTLSESQSGGQPD